MMISRGERDDDDIKGRERDDDIRPSDEREI